MDTTESESLEQWMNQCNEKKAMKQCPLCKTSILKTQSFMNQMKAVIVDISKIKIKQYRELAVINSHRNLGIYICVR